MREDDFEESEEYEGAEEYEYESSISAESNVLTHDEACKCLHTLGKCDSGLKYAYLGLDASNKRLTDINVIPTFKYVVYVNVSGNKLTAEALRVCTKMTYLLMLEADRNEIASAELVPMHYLQVLTLNRNSLTDTMGICHKLLECLELSYNKIDTVTLNPYVLENLKVLELRGNLLTSTNGIFCPGLIRLYLAENRITRIEGLETLVNLRVLHLRGNSLSNLDGFDSRCGKLNYLNLRGNKIARTSELKKLECLTGLETLIILENPIENESEEEESAYRRFVLATLPNLKRLNKDPVLREETKEAERLQKLMTENWDDFAHFDDRNAGSSAKV